ncbi:MAG: hypothetical protein JWQ35_1091, partial [Bacteriovoracaceae bacterium]|nr:hypothetical protein [Bacteriovoracaceae bacterium]
MKTKLGFLLLFVSLPLTSAFSGGLDLNFNYGTRYIYLGGNQVSISKDAYAPFYNPAGMSGVEKPEVAVNISNLITQISAPIGGDNQQRKSQWNLGPLFYLGGVYPINDRLTFGFAVFPTNLQGAKYTPATFGTITGREQSDFLARIEFAPSIAFRVY